jgi:phospholipid-translocating ATPase
LQDCLLGDNRGRDEPLIVRSTNGKTNIEYLTEQKKVQELIKLLSICHDCESEEAVVDGKEIKFYQGSSPDEITLVDFARDQGFEFMEATDKIIKIKVLKGSGMTDKHGETESREYIIHKKIPFTSGRARMSLLFTDPDDGKVKLFIKGADSKIKERLDPKQNSEEVLERVEDFLNKASITGLRTLLMAMRVLHEDEFRQIQADIIEAEADVINTKAKLDQISEEFEKGLVLLGATCVEDKLQEDVAE